MPASEAPASAGSASPAGPPGFGRTAALLCGLHSLQERTLHAVDAALGTSPPVGRTAHRPGAAHRGRLPAEDRASAGHRSPPGPAWRSPPSPDSPIGRSAVAEMDAAARKFIEATRPAGLSRTVPSDPDFRTRDRPSPRTPPRRDGEGSPAWLESVSPLLTSEVEKLERSYQQKRSARSTPASRRSDRAREPEPRPTLFGLDELDLERVLDAEEEDNLGLTSEPVARRLFGRLPERTMPPAAAGPGSRTSARGPLQRAELSGLDVTDMFRDALPRGSTHSASRQRSSLADRFSVRRQSIPASPEPPANPLEKEPSAPTADELFGGDAPAPSFRGAPRSEPGAKLAEREIAAGLSKLDDLEAKFREQTARIGTRSAPTTPAKPAPRAPATPARAAPPAVPAPAPRSAPPPQRTRMSGFSLPSVASKEEIEDAIQRLEELEVVIKGRSSATRRPERGDRSLLSEVETATKRLDELEQVFWNEVVGGEFALPGAREAEAPRTPRSSLGAGGRAPRTPEIVVDDADAGNDSGFVGGATPSPSRFGSAAPSPRRTLLPERGAPGSPAGLGLLPKPRPGAPPAPARDTASPSYPGSSNEALAGSAASVSVAVSPSEQDPLSSIVETARALNPLVASSTQLAYSAASSPAARTADDGTSEVLLALAKVGESVQVGLAAIQRYARAEASLKAGNAPATARSTPSATPPRSFADYEVPSPRPSAGSTRDVFRFRHHHDGVPCYGGRSCEWNRE